MKFHNCCESDGLAAEESRRQRGSLVRSGRNAREEMLGLHRRLRNSSSSVRTWACRAYSKLFVGGLSYDTNETILRDAFSLHGDIIEVKVICDHKNGKSKGYGFVKFTSEAAAVKALTQMDGQVLDGRNIRVHQANKEG